MGFNPPHFSYLGDYLLEILQVLGIKLMSIDSNSSLVKGLAKKQQIIPSTCAFRTTGSSW